jgi:hypothetical protein
VRKRFAFVTSAAALAVLAGCAPQAARCPAGTGQPMQVYSLFFGRAVPNRPDVAEPEWQAFVEDVITPALPAGFTVLDARGAWRSPRSGRTVHEATKLLIVALPDAAGSLDAVNRVRTEYQARFDQQLVGMTVHPSCGLF